MIGTRKMSISLLPLMALAGGCMPLAEQESLSSASVASVEAGETKAVVEIANRAADWQLANLEDLGSYIRFISRETPNPRGWVKGTFFLGLADYAE